MKKPRITKDRLSWKFNRRKGIWEPHHRVTFYRDGKRRERTILLDWQGDPERLDALYWECETGRHDRQKPAPPKHSWRALIEAWRSDPRVQAKLSDGTKRKYRPVMDRLMEKNGDKAVAKTTRTGLRAAHDALSATPRKADWYLQVVSLLWNYARHQLDWPLGDNPATGIEKFGTTKAFKPWPDWMVARLTDAPRDVQTVANLILGTGQRPNAAIVMRWDQFNGDWMTVTDEKGDQELDVFCPADLRAYLDALPKTGAHVLAKNLREPKGYNAVEKQFRAWREALGDRARPYVLHGLRKLAIVRLAEAGCSDAEIQAVTGQSAETVAYYRKQASRKRLSRSAQERRK